MYPTSTDSELLRCAEMQTHPGVKRLAQRLADRGAIAEKCRAELVELAQLLQVVESGNTLPERVRLFAIDRARELAQRLDWRTHVPHYTPEN